MQPNAPRNRDPQAVQVSRHVLWALAAAALAFALATAYLLGRLSGGAPSPQPSVPSPDASAAATPAAGPQAAPGPSAVAYGTPAALLPAAGADTWPAAAAGDSPHAPVVSPASADADRERLQVQRYFAALDGLLQGQSLSGDPQALAQKLVTQAIGGDPSGLEALVATQQEATRALRGLEPPAPCVEHHRRTLELAEKTLTLVRQVQTGLASGDTGRLLELASLSRDAEQQARELQALDRQLRQTWGVPAQP